MVVQKALWSKESGSLWRNQDRKKAWAKAKRFETCRAGWTESDSSHTNCKEKWAKEATRFWIHRHPLHQSQNWWTLRTLSAQRGRYQKTSECAEMEREEESYILLEIVQTIWVNGLQRFQQSSHRLSDAFSPLDSEINATKVLSRTILDCLVRTELNQESIPCRRKATNGRWDICKQTRFLFPVMHRIKALQVGHRSPSIRWLMVWSTRYDDKTILTMYSL